MKHARPDYQHRIVDTDGKIPDDEPVFLLRAQDELAASLVVLWAERAHTRGASTEIVKMALQHAAAMRQWAHEHGSKVPDLPEAKP